jgi:hypothetical protein
MNIVMIRTAFMCGEIILLTGLCEYRNELADITERFDLRKGYQLRK